MITTLETWKPDGVGEATKIPVLGAVNATMPAELIDGG